jgi:leucyl-tRNA synthetase
MICVNELTDLKCHKRSILEQLLVVISPYAPHIAEELWAGLGHDGSISTVSYPEFIAEYVKENTVEYPVSFNGKMRFKLVMPVEATREEIEQKALADEKAARWLEGKEVRKVIVVPNKIINIVVS